LQITEPEPETKTVQSPLESNRKIIDGYAQSGEKGEQGKSILSPQITESGRKKEDEIQYDKTYHYINNKNLAG
jgi:hypothetical protein